MKQIKEDNKSNKKSLLSDIHVDVKTIESYRDELTGVNHSEQLNCKRKPKLLKKST